MTKKLIKFLLFLIIVTTIIIIYLSFFGINTKKFNDTIKTKILNINNKVNLELKTVKLLLNPIDLSINVKTFSPEIFINNNKLELEYIKTNISLKSFINKDFSIDDLQVSTKAIRLNDIVLLVRSFKNSTEMLILDNIIKDGFLVGDINLNFDRYGKIKNDYEVKGFIKKGKISILSKYSIDDLNLLFNIKNKEYYLQNLEGNFNQIKLSSPSVKVKEKNNQFFVNGKLISKNSDMNIKLLNDLLESSIKSYGIEDIEFSSDNDFNFKVNKKFKISNFNLESKINLNKLVYKKDLPELRRYLPNFKDTIKLKDHKILFDYKNNNFNVKGKGNISIENDLDFLNYEFSKNNNNNNYNFNTSVSINKNYFLLDLLSYKKNKNSKSTINFSGYYKKDKKIKFKSISLIDDNKNTFVIQGLDLDKNFKINNIDKFDLNFTNDNKIKNQISIKKDKKNYKVIGKNFDATKLINELLNDEDNNEDSSIFNNLNSTIDIKINKTYLDSSNFVNNLSGNINFINNKIDKLNLESTFPNNKKLILVIKTNDNNEKITKLFSGYAKPLINQYKFIKGFEEGVLDLYSIKKDDISNSLLIIDNFKVQEVPVLAKLLTLASLQGIADLLTGEGIRFTDFEMKFSNKKGLMTIEEMYAIGPAISILMNGYIESKKLISLRGTLVPATTINRSIASIPLIGNILVGKKTGEGIFGVSFKIKGPPKNLKTTVNPIKTLTPRFITRTLEKIKKN
jgi:hypothetical protein